jgi:hypothetical protein
MPAARNQASVSNNSAAFTDRKPQRFTNFRDGVVG